MKQTKIILWLSVLGLAAFACTFGQRAPEVAQEVAEQVIGETLRGSGNVQTEAREVSDFSEVELGGMGDLTITQGETEALEIEAEDNLIPYIITEVKGNRLMIYEESGYAFNPTKPIQIYLTVKSLDTLVLSGFGNVNADELNLGDLEITLSGSGNIELSDLIAESLDVTLSGFGNMTVSGAVPREVVKLSGAGAYDAGNLESDSATATLSGFGSCTVWVHEDLDATLSGSGSLSYYGNPSLKQDVSGFGSIHALGEK